jgi:hypothetical protein
MKSVPNKSDGFCNDRCRKEFVPINTEAELNPIATFNLVAAAMEQAFAGQASKNKDMQKTNKEFFNSKLVKMWCDCSNNFSQKRLTKSYEEFISSSAEHS